MHRIKQARNICIWYFQNYSGIQDFKPEEFKRPVRQISLKETTKQLEEEIERLRIENKDLLLHKQQALLLESKTEKDNRRKHSKSTSEKLDISEEEARLLIDDALKDAGWTIIRYKKDIAFSSLQNHAVEEYMTESGEVDYAFFVEGKLLGVLEAKKPSVNPKNVLDQQAKRYSKSVKNGVGNWRGYKVPFIYASNSEQIYFIDIRNSTNTDRELFGYHTPSALKEKFERKEAQAEEWLIKTKIQHPWTRPYQEKAIKATENAIIQGKDKLMLAMATGTGKTFTASNLIYRFLLHDKNRD